MRLGSTLSHATPATPAGSPKQVSSAVVQGPCVYQNPDPRAGFTLLELSIVLLTVGLLIFFGLMHLSEMRRLTTRNPLQCQQNLTGSVLETTTPQLQRVVLSAGGRTLVLMLP